jgi:hypothetical protein
MTEHVTPADAAETTAGEEVLAETEEIADLAETEMTEAREATDQELQERQELQDRKHNNQQFDLVILPRDGFSIARLFICKKFRIATCMITKKRL